MLDATNDAGRSDGTPDAARAVAGPLDAANDTWRSDGAPDVARTFAEPLDAANDTGRSDGAPDAARAVTGLLDAAASDTGAGPLGDVDNAPQLRDVLLFCSEIKNVSSS